MVRKTGARDVVWNHIVIEQFISVGGISATEKLTMETGKCLRLALGFVVGLAVT